MNVSQARNLISRHQGKNTQGGLGDQQRTGAPGAGKQERLEQGAARDRSGGGAQRSANAGLAQHSRGADQLEMSNIRANDEQHHDN